MCRSVCTVSHFWLLPCSCDFIQWLAAAGWIRGGARSADSHHDQLEPKPANYTTVRSDCWRPTDFTAQQPGGSPRYAWYCKYVWHSAHIVGLAHTCETAAVVLCRRCGGRNAGLSDSLLFFIAASDRCHDITRHQLSGQERWPTNEKRDTPGKEQVEWKRFCLFSQMKLVGNITLWWFSNTFNAIICSWWIWPIQISV